MLCRFWKINEKMFEFSKKVNILEICLELVVSRYKKNEWKTDLHNV